MKVCRRCNIEKSNECFSPNKRNKDGLFSYCKICVRDIHEEYRRKKGIRPLGRQTENQLQVKKTCTICKIEKPSEEFRVRRKKYKNNEHVFLSPHCKKCERDLAGAYYESRKNDPIFKEKNRLRVKNYAEKNCDQIKAKRKTSKYLKKHSEWEKKRYARKRDEINAKAKEKRQHPEYKKMMREYRKRNKEKIFHQEVITKKRYHEKNRDSVTDRYVINNLRQKGVLDPTPDQIEVQRVKILTKRLKKKIHERHSKP